MKSISKAQAADISAKTSNAKLQTGSKPQTSSKAHTSSKLQTNPKAQTKPKSHPNPKRVGEICEAAFLHKAESLGFRVAKPWGDSERYDFILDNGERLWRVQVKGTSRLRFRGYDVQPSHRGEFHKAAYTAAEIDFLVAHIIPLDLWYVVPVEVMGPGMTLRLYPEGNCRHPRFEQYREAWHLLLGARGKEEGNQAGSKSESHSRACLECRWRLLGDSPAMNPVRRRKQEAEAGT